MRFALLVLSASALFAQQPTVSPSGFGRILFPGGGGPGTGTPVGTSGFGRIVYPGTGAPAVLRSPGGAIVPPPTVAHQLHTSPVIIPYPIYYTGGYYNYDVPQAQLASAYVSTPQTAETAPVVIINQYFRPDAAAPVTSYGQNYAPQLRAEETAPAPVANGTADTPVFIIAMKDHSIFAANAYWVENGTLNYITLQGSQNSASLDLVDRELSLRLNKDRNVSFGLPAN